MESREFYENVDMSQRGWAFLPIKEDEWEWVKSVDGTIVASGCNSPQFQKDFKELREQAL